MLQQYPDKGGIRTAALSRGLPISHIGGHQEYDTHILILFEGSQYQHKVGASDAGELGRLMATVCGSTGDRPADGSDAFE